MNDTAVITQYLGSCLGGTLAVSECGPVWYMAIIALLVVAALVALVVLRVRGAGQAGDAPH